MGRLKNMQSKLQKLIEERKKTQENGKDLKPSPYFEPLIGQIIEAMIGKIKTLRGEDGHTPTNEEILEILNPYIENIKKEFIPTKENLLKMVASLIPKVEDGKDGKKGEKGDNGEDGKDGKDGRDGRDGRDAEIPSLKELAINTINVLESLKDEDRLDASAIKNLEKVLEKFVRNIAIEESRIGFKQGGPGIIFTDKATIGGSGQPGDPLYVQNINGNFVDNEIISGGGNDWILAHIPILGSVHLTINGQRGMEGSDYTISGKNITTVLSWTAGLLIADYRYS